MNNEEKQPFSTPLLTISSFDQADNNIASTLDTWSIGEIQDISK